MRSRTGPASIGVTLPSVHGQGAPRRDGAGERRPRARPDSLGLRGATAGRDDQVGLGAEAALRTVGADAVYPRTVASRGSVRTPTRRAAWSAAGQASLQIG